MHPGAYPVAPAHVPAETCVVEAAITQGHQKLALVHLGAAGGSWCLASDEGAYLRGTDLAPAPLMHWAAGVHADFCHRTRARRVTIEFGYAVSGSFAQGGAKGEAFAPEIHGAGAGFEESPLLSAMQVPLRNTFALYVNGRRRPVTGVHPSSASDEEDPFLKHAAAPKALFQTRDLIGKQPLDPEAKIFSMPTSTGGLRFGSRIEGGCGPVGGLVHSTASFPGIPASRFTFTSDASGGHAPSGLAYAWAGVAFCYLTQLSRYIDTRKLGVSGARLVQRGPLAGPVDTHLFLNGAADDATMQELLAMGARTCYLHATLGAALSPRVFPAAAGPAARSW
jgi:hypothetical protein